MKNDSLLFYRIVRDFLTIYLPKQRGASQNTAKSYQGYPEPFSLIISVHRRARH